MTFAKANGIGIQESHLGIPGLVLVIFGIAIRIVAIWYKTTKPSKYKFIHEFLTFSMLVGLTLLLNQLKIIFC